MSCPVELYAVEIGRFARRVLRQPATVIARFARSAYVENRAGIACIGGQGLGSGPLNAVVPALAHIPETGTVLIVRTRGATTWRAPRPLRPDPRRLRRLPTLQARGVFATPHPGAHALRAWLAQGAKGSPPPQLERLIGAGPGLTPAGDDFIGGALIALRALRRHACAARLSAWALRRARTRTSRISRAHLACAAQGEGGSALHALLNALVCGRKKLSRQIAAIDAVGHTSGWDAAAGAALVLELAMPPRRPRARSRAPATRQGIRADAHRA